MKDDAPPTRIVRMPNINRRRWLLGAAACAAAGAGTGLAWRTYRTALRWQADQTRWWKLEFETPSGGVLQAKTLFGRPLLVNFWATWCPPCIEELPLLSSFFIENEPKGWQVLGLAVDKVEPVRRFLTRAPVQFPVAIANFSGIEISRSLGNFSGSLPFSAVFGSDGKISQRKLGPLTRADLKAWSALS